MAWPGLRLLHRLGRPIRVLFWRAYPTCVRATAAGFCFNIGRGVSAFARCSLAAVPRWSASSFLLVCAARSFSSRGSSCSSCRTPRGSRKNIRLNTRRRVNSRRTSQRDWLHRRDGYRPIATAQVTACLRCGHLATPAGARAQPRRKNPASRTARHRGTQAPERETTEQPEVRTNG